MPLDAVPSTLPSRGRRFVRRLGLWAIVLGLAAGPHGLPRAAAEILIDDGEAAAAGPPVVEADACGSGDDVWVVSTRRLPDIGCVPSHVSFDVERLVTEDRCRRWERDDLAGVLADPARPLVIFVHGNRYDPADAKSHGLLLARRQAAACPTAGPTRTVIFSWPSVQQGRLLKDSRVKYDRCMSEGHYLAWFLGQVGPERPAAIVAYSYGGLIALEAFDHLARVPRSDQGGIGGCADRLARRHLVIVAAAVRSDALAPCGEYHRVLHCIDRLTLLNNTQDRALKFFRFIDPSLAAEALGHEQMPARWVPPEVEFRQFDAAPVLGKSHRFLDYLEVATLSRRLVGGTLEGLRAD